MTSTNLSNVTGNHDYEQLLDVVISRILNYVKISVISRAEGRD